MITVNNIEVDTKSTFPDGTLLMKYQYNEKICHPHINVEWKYENDGELFALICLTKQLPRAKEKHLIMKYLPHARQDRVKKPEDVFTLKYFAEIINSLHFSTVWVRDAHSNVSLALINNVCDMGAEPYIRQAIKLSGADAVFYPDEGAMKRYSDRSELPYAFGMKKRDWQTGKILGLEIINPENIVGKDVLIVDDICSRGGTFYHSAKALKAAGAKSVSLYVTHLEETVTLGEMAASDDLVDHIYTTESIFPAKLCESKHGYDPYWAKWITIMK